MELSLILYTRGPYIVLILDGNSASVAHLWSEFFSPSDFLDKHCLSQARPIREEKLISFTIHIIWILEHAGSENWSLKKSPGSATLISVLYPDSCSWSGSVNWRVSKAGRAISVAVNLPFTSFYIVSTLFLLILILIGMWKNCFKKLKLLLKDIFPLFLYL